MSVHPVLPAGIPMVWEHVAPLIDDALPYANGRFDIDDVLDRLLDGSMQLWVWMNGSIRFAVVTQFTEYPGKYVCDLLFCGGEGEYAQAVVDQIEAVAKDEGCTSMQCYGRRGWGRRFPDYEELFSYYGKEL